MIGVFHRLIRFLPGPFRARHGEEFAFYLENEARRMDGAIWSERLSFIARTGLDFASTFQREWRRALPWEIQLALVGIGTLIGFEISSANFFGVCVGLLTTSGLFVFQWIAIRSSVVSKAPLAVWIVSYVMAGSLLPGILVWFPLGHRQTSLCEIISSAVLAIFIVDGIRNDGWVASPYSRANKEHRFSQKVTLSLAILWPLLSAIAWGRAWDLPGVWGFLTTSTFSCFFSYHLGLRLQRIWREPHPFRELPAYVYHYPPGG
jgi:lipid-A-disaccharide synthase-like uncharacterized protein